MDMKAQLRAVPIPYQPGTQGAPGAQRVHQSFAVLGGGRTRSWYPFTTSPSSPSAAASDTPLLLAVGVSASAPSLRQQNADETIHHAEGVRS